MGAVMAETFYGSWRVNLGEVDLFFRQRFVITGSENADGRHYVQAGGPVDIQVNGDVWSIDMEIEPFPPQGSDEGWDTRTIGRAMSFTAQDGLIVKLTVAGQPGFSLICTSLDPAIKPNPTPNPYDFTLPEHGSPASVG
jgi:hypothetical protein